MAHTYLLYNPLAGNGTGKQEAQQYGATLETEPIYRDLTAMEHYADFFAELTEEDTVILCGGDGTLNRFAWDTRDLTLNVRLYYHATGTGNDFLRDLEKTAQDGPVLLNPYLKNLPHVTVNGKETTFLNGVGYGIDGYCCEVGDKIRATSKKAVNYAGIAIKGLLFHFKPRYATVTVDGVRYEFPKTWIAPVMHGRCYGGGMIMAPGQVRNNADGTLSLVVFHGSGKLKTLWIFPKIFKGMHTKYTKHIAVLTGKHFEVSFDRPTALQIDGETVLNVTRYTVDSHTVLAQAEPSDENGTHVQNAQNVQSE